MCYSLFKQTNYLGDIIDTLRVLIGWLKEYVLVEGWEDYLD